MISFSSRKSAEWFFVMWAFKMDSEVNLFPQSKHWIGLTDSAPGTKNPHKKTEDNRPRDVCSLQNK